MSAVYNEGDRVKITNYPVEPGDGVVDPQGKIGTVIDDDGFFIEVQLDGDFKPSEFEDNWLFTADELEAVAPEGAVL